MHCLYLPTLLGGEREEKRIKYRDMAEFILDKIDHRDEHAVNVAYQFYKMSKETFFSIEVFMGFMEKEALLVQARERQKTESRKVVDPTMERCNILQEDILPLSNEIGTDNETVVWKWWIPVVLLVIGILFSIL